MKNLIFLSSSNVCKTLKNLLHISRPSKVSTKNIKFPANKKVSNRTCLPSSACYSISQSTPNPNFPKTNRRIRFPEGWSSSRGPPNLIALQKLKPVASWSCCGSNWAFQCPKNPWRPFRPEIRCGCLWFRHSSAGDWRATFSSCLCATRHRSNGNSPS